MGAVNPSSPTYVSDEDVADLVAGGQIQVLRVVCQAGVATPARGWTQWAHCKDLFTIRCFGQSDCDARLSKSFLLALEKFILVVCAPSFLWKTHNINLEIILR